MKDLFDAILEGDIAKIDRHINELSTNNKINSHFFKIDISDKEHPTFIEYCTGINSLTDPGCSQIGAFNAFVDIENPYHQRSDKRVVPNNLVLDPFSLAYLYNKSSFLHMIEKYPEYIKYFRGVFQPQIVEKTDLFQNPVIAVYPPSTESIPRDAKKQLHAMTFTGQFDGFNNNMQANLAYYKKYGFTPINRQVTYSLPILPADQLCKWLRFSTLTDKLLRDNITKCLIEGLLTTLSFTFCSKYLESLYATNVRVFKMIVPQLIQLLKTRKIDENTQLYLDSNIRSLFSDSRYLSSDDTNNGVYTANRIFNALWDDYCQYRQESAVKPKNKDIEEKPLDVLISAFLHACGVIPFPLTKENFALCLTHTYQCGTRQEDNSIVFNEEDAKKIPAEKWEAMDKLYPESEITGLMLSLITPGEDYLENLENILLDKDCTRLLFTIRDNNQTPDVLRKAIHAALTDTPALLILSLRKQHEQKAAPVIPPAVAATTTSVDKPVGSITLEQDNLVLSRENARLKALLGQKRPLDQEGADQNLSKARSLDDDSQSTSPSFFYPPHPPSAPSPTSGRRNPGDGPGRSPKDEQWGRSGTEPKR